MPASRAHQLDHEHVHDAGRPGPGGGRGGVDAPQELPDDEEVHQHGTSTRRRRGTTPRPGVLEKHLRQQGTKRRTAAFSRLPFFVGGRTIRKPDVECLWSVALPAIVVSPIGPEGFEPPTKGL